MAVLILLLASASGALALSPDGPLEDSYAGIFDNALGIGTDLPWFNSSTSFSWFGFETNLSFFDEFFLTGGSPLLGEVISSPVKFDILGKEPAKVYLVGSSPISYRQYKSFTTSLGMNQLWIMGIDNDAWTQYLVCPAGSLVNLLAYTPMGGTAVIYKIYPNDTVQKTSYRMFADYSNMEFKATNPGRNVVFFIAGDRPSNAVIIDVLPISAVGTPASGQMTDMPPASWGQAGTQVPSATTVPGGVQYPSGLITGPVSTPSQEAPTHYPGVSSGSSRALIVSSGMRNYLVYVDGKLIGQDGQGGDVSDGKFSFTVTPGYHNIRVFDGEFNYPKTMFFDAGGFKQINVEPGTAAYLFP